MFQELVLYKSCPLCDSSEFVTKLKANCTNYPHYKHPLSDTLVWLQCKSCGHVFREGYYTEEAFQILVSNIHKGQLAGEDFERKRYVWAPVVEKMIFFRNEGIWLDVGFGDGALLLTAEEYGFRPVGIDIRQPNVDVLTKLGINVACMDFTKLDLKPRASVISLCDVLEHMPFPLMGLAAAHRNLADDGFLLLSLPNIDSHLWKILDASQVNPYWMEMEHFHNFGRSSLFKCLEQTGFVPEKFGISYRYRACMEVIARKRQII